MASEEPENTSSRTYKQTKIEGFTLSESFLNVKPTIDNWEVDEDDIWIVGSPKSGTTWTQEMVWLIANDLDYEGAKQPIHERTPLFEYTPLADFRVLGEKNNVELPLFRADSLRYIKETKENGKPMCIKTHLSFNLLPIQIKEGSKKPKIIFVARNPKDCCVSLYHYMKNFFELDMPMERYVKLYLVGAFPYGPIWDHTISYWNERHRPNLLITTYEEMSKNLPAVINKVTEFLEKKLADDQVNKLVAHLSFQSMKRNPAVNYEDMVELHTKLGIKSGNGSFIRSGKVDSHKEELAPEQIEEFETLGLKKMNESGWKFV